MTDRELDRVFDVRDILVARIKETVATQVRAYQLNDEQTRKLLELLNEQFRFRIT